MLPLSLGRWKPANLRASGQSKGTIGGAQKSLITPTLSLDEPLPKEPLTQAPENAKAEGPGAFQPSSGSHLQILATSS